MFLCFGYNKASFKFCESFRFFLKVLIEKHPKIGLINCVKKMVICLFYPLFLHANQ